jgi:hypothetical protein
LFRAGTHPVSLRVVEAVASLRGVDPVELEPLAGSIDPDALNDLFDPVDDRRRAVRGDVAFAYEGVYVTVTSEGEIDLREPDPSGGAGSE